MITFPNAKINLGLHILRKREDGFHDIETVFYPITLHDSLEIYSLQLGETSLKQYGPRITDGQNLCVKAYELMKAEYDIPSVEMHLLKQIPLGAGLGGGSSDATHTLLMLNDIFDLCIGSSELEKLAARLGSDCAFFIRNNAVFANGRGEVFAPIDIDLEAFKIKVVHPDIHISTAEAYSMITPNAERPSLKEIIIKPISHWKDHLVNDFEDAVFKKYPEVRAAKEAMYEDGAIYASMSGSGSAVFGIFKK